MDMKLLFEIEKRMINNMLKDLKLGVGSLFQHFWRPV